MAQWHGISRRKPTGGRLNRVARKKRRRDISAEKQFALLGDRRRKVYRTRGGGNLVRVLSDEMVNVTDPKSGTTSKQQVNNVIGCPANPNYVRRNILVKGSVVETELGEVKITSRPGQDGILNGILL